jgi:hypothetical protein
MTTRPVFHFHIPKTGGQTFGRRITAALPLEHTYFMGPDVRADDDAQLRELASNKRVVSAHVSGPLFAVCKAFDTVTLVRHPVAHIVSHYLHIRREPDSILHPLVQNLPFERVFALVPDWFFNFQARYIIEAFRLRTAAEEVEPFSRRAMRLLRDCMDEITWVGTTEGMDSFGRAFAANSGVPVVEAASLNVAATAGTSDLAARLGQWLRERPELFAADLLAYEEATRRQTALRERATFAAMAAQPRGVELLGRAGVVFESATGQIRLTDGWHPPQLSEKWGVEHLAGRVAKLTCESPPGARRLIFDMGFVAGFEARDLRGVDVETGEYLPLGVEPLDDSFRVSVRLGDKPTREIALVAPRCFPLGMFSGDYANETLAVFSAGNWRLEAA